MQKCTRSPLKTYADILLYPNPRAWMILVSVWIGPSHSTLKNHSLKFSNQIDSDLMLLSKVTNSELPHENDVSLFLINS